MKTLVFHAFTHQTDAYVDTRAEADYIVNQWREDGATDLRIYEEWWSNDPTDDTTEEDCVFAEGEFPY